MDCGIVTICTQSLFCRKVNSSGIWICITFMFYFNLFFVLFGVHFIFFLIFFLSSLLIFLLGLLPSLHILFYFYAMGKQFAEIKVCTYYKTNQSQLKNYESYYYRTLTEGKHLHMYATLTPRK